jgi:hypothetical protein
MRYWKILVLVSVVLTICWTQLIYSQECQAEITKVEVGENEVTITYDLIGDPAADYTVGVFLLSERDPKMKMELKRVKGNVRQGRFAGKDNIIKWNMKEEFPTVVAGESYRFELHIAKVTGVAIPSWYYYVGASAIVGGLSYFLFHKPPSETIVPEKTIPMPPSR